MVSPWNPKQKEFILNATKKYNLTHGAVRTGKTVCTLYAFMREVAHCPGSSIFIFGYSLGTIYRNLISLLFDSEELNMFAPFCTWHKADSVLTFGGKKIKCIGAADEGALGVIQGLTIDLCLCDEMTLYPENVIYMIDTRLSKEHSKLFASMNPKHPDHILKRWIDKAAEGNPLYYALHFEIQDNAMFLPPAYAENLRDNLKGLFFKRNYLGLWCMAEGAIFDGFDRKLHTADRAPTAADYYIAGIDYGTSLVFACVLIGINTGRAVQAGKRMWVEKEYYWDVSQTKRQKTNADYVRDLVAFLDNYPLKCIYVDPSAAAFKLEMQRAGMHMVDGKNEVLDGIQYTAQLINEGTLSILRCCTNLIREVEGYVWDSRKAEKTGLDAPIKKNDHAIDAMRYAVYTHKVNSATAPPVARPPGYYRMG